MTNKMKSVGEALQGFLETAVPSPLSAEERERLRLEREAEEERKMR